MFGNVTKDKTRAISVQSQQTTKDRRHFMNYCFTHAGKFSCAVDCFLELTFPIFKDSLNCIERNEFFQKLSEACFQLDVTRSFPFKPKNVCVGGQVYSSYKELHHIFPLYQRQSFSTGQIPAEQRLHFSHSELPYEK